MKDEELEFQRLGGKKESFCIFLERTLKGREQRDNKRLLGQVSFRRRK